MWLYSQLSIPTCFIMFGLNDIYDVESDKLNSRKKEKMYGIIINKEDISEIKKLSLFFSIIIFLVSLFSFNLIHIFLTIIALISVYIYSVPPIRIKGRPIIDSLFNMLFLYLPFAIGYSLSGSLGFLNPQFILFSLTGSAAHAIFAVSDIDSDKKVGIKTIATEYGHVFSLLFAFIFLVVNIPFALNIELGAGILLILLSLFVLFLIFSPKFPYYNLIILFIIIWMVYAVILYSIDPSYFNLSWLKN